MLKLIGFSEQQWGSGWTRITQSGDGKRKITFLFRVIKVTREAEKVFRRIHILLDIKLRLGRRCGCQIQICKSQPKGLKTIHFLPFKKQTFYCKALYWTLVAIHLVISQPCLHVETQICRGAFLCKELTITLRVDYTKRMALSNLSRSCISLGLDTDWFEFYVFRPFPWALFTSSDSLSPQTVSCNASFHSVRCFFT